MSGTYNGMPAAVLRDAHWQASRRAQALAAPADTAQVEMAQVQMALLPEGEIAMRNSRHPGGPALIYTHAEIAAFIAGAKDGDFDDLLDLTSCGAAR